LDLSAIDTASVEVTLKMRKGFVPGEIVLGFRDTTSLRTCVRFCASKGLSINKASGFRFLTDSISADSAQDIQNVLSGKHYLNGGPIYLKNGRVVVSFFRDLDSDLLQDWETTSRLLGFQEASGGATEGALKLVVSTVSIGSEHEWIRSLSGEPLLWFIGLNVVYTIN